MKVGKGKAKATAKAKDEEQERFKEIVWEQVLPAAIHESQERKGNYKSI